MTVNGSLVARGSLNILRRLKTVLLSPPPNQPSHLILNPQLRDFGRHGKFPCLCISPIAQESDFFRPNILCVCFDRLDATRIRLCALPLRVGFAELVLISSEPLFCLWFRAILSGCTRRNRHVDQNSILTIDDPWFRNLTLVECA